MFEIKWIDYGLAELRLTRVPASTEDALEISIAKWEQVVAFYEECPDDLIRDGGRFTCALCVLCCSCHPYCRNCPVALATGHDLCRVTPYDDYTDAIEAEDPDDAYLAAKAEVAFLKSLLPQ